MEDIKKYAVKEHIPTVNEGIQEGRELVFCKDCKYWKDSDGVYRRGIGAESKCPINNKEVFEGKFYCADAERRE